MLARRSSPQVALVIKWPAALTSEIVIRQITRRLIDARLPATWSLEEAAQAESLQSWGATRFGGDAALWLEAGAFGAARGEPALRWSRRLRGRLEQFRAAGVGAETLHSAGAVANSPSLQYLGSAGIRAIVADGSGPAARPLPLGMWQFAPSASLPEVDHWWRVFRRKIRLIPDEGRPSPAVATIDLFRLAALGPRAWQTCDAALAEVAEARARGAVAVGTVAEMAAALAESTAVKPQRSILRTAA